MTSQRTANGKKKLVLFHKIRLHDWTEGTAAGNGSEIGELTERRGEEGTLFTRAVLVGFFLVFAASLVSLKILHSS